MPVFGFGPAQPRISCVRALVWGIEQVLLRLSDEPLLSAELCAEVREWADRGRVLMTRLASEVDEVDIERPTDPYLLEEEGGINGGGIVRDWRTDP